MDNNQGSKKGDTMDEIDLNDSRIMSSSEAAQKWRISDSRLRQKAEEFPEGTARKFGKQWVVSAYGMLQMFGPNMVEEEKDVSKLNTTYKTVKDMADELGLSIQRISEHAALVGEIVLVWLDNTHWKELKLGKGDYASRDYGGIISLGDKLKDIKRELNERREKLSRGLMVIDKFCITPSAMEYLIQKTIKI